MSTPRSFSSLLLVVAVAACSRNVPSLVPEPAAPPPPKLEFRPPGDSPLVETVSSTVRRSGAPGVQAAELTTVSRFTPEQGRWLLSQSVTGARYSRDGTPVETVVDDVLTAVPLRVRLAADGTFVEVLEPGAFLKALKAVAPAGQDLTALERFFAPEAVEARARDEWALKYGGLYGRGLERGAKFYGVGTVPLGGRDVAYLLERTFTGTQPTEQGEAAVFTLRCLEAPGENAPEPVREALMTAGEVALTPGVECEGEQLLGMGRFLPVRRSLTLRAPLDGETWTWTARSALEPRATEEEK